MAVETVNEIVTRLPELRAEYERLGRLIKALEAFSGDGEGSEDESEIGAPVITPRPLSRTPSRSQIGPDEFVNQSTSQAIRSFLALMGKGNPQGPREMAKALVAGGRDSDEEKAYVNVTSALKRMNKMGVITQVRRGQWGLSEWYGNRASKPAAARSSELNGAVD